MSLFLTYVNHLFSRKYQKMCRIFLLVIAFIVAPVVFAEPFWGSKASQPVDTDPKKLKAGQFIWKGNAVPFGPVVALVSIPEQKVYLYRNGILIGVSTVSTGKRGYGTPAGVFTVLEKDRYHRSRTYNNAPMPYANRLTWGGVALHAGHIPGYPASHGCIRLPTQFARFLFDVSALGMTVVIAGYQSDTLELAHPSVLSPVDSKEGKIVNMPNLIPTEEFRWQPENAQEGYVSIVINETDQYILVYRNGIEIGRAKLSITQPQKNLGTHAFIMQEGEGIGINPFLNTAPPRRWMAIGIPGHTKVEGMILNASFFEHLNIPIEFAKAIDGILTAGTTLLITDTPMLREQMTGEAPVSKPRCIRGNCVNGKGTQIYADGSKYIGQFKNGLSEGQGKLTFPNGEQYVGKFENDKFQWKN